MKVSRLIEYEGSEQWVQRTLDKSLPEGITKLGTEFSITITTLKENEEAKRIK